MLVRCSKCMGEKPVAEFAMDATKPTGRKSWCKLCDNARSIVYYEANRARTLARMKARSAELARSRPPKACKRCGNATPNRRRVYCDPCKAYVDRARNSRPRPRTNSTARGYGQKHQLERKRVALIVDAGRALCARCAEPIVPGEFWDLDHTDDRSGYRGPAHRRCNRAAGARKGNRQRVLSPARASREW